ncbi:MAG: A/G-specific adenine glycosylase [Burkholderiaceae bacterium]
MLPRQPPDPAPPIDDFASAVAEWQKRAGRHHLPWQRVGDPYKIWLSEIMLQQTQVGTAAGYYKRFLERFPTLNTLALATQDEVMPFWAGLGYYARARNLHRCAQTLVAQWEGQFPRRIEDIMQLPGIGRSTAAAIAAFAYGAHEPIMDGNVKRVFTRYFGIYGPPGRRATELALWRKAETIISAAPTDLDMAAYTQGLMDLGSAYCTRTRPNCAECPLSLHCYARRESRQNELPTAKLKKVNPERQCKMLILQNQGVILLERQPSPGIWGGLWSLPRYDDMDALNSACINWGETIEEARKMPVISHTFSHFKLQIEPWRLLCRTPLIAEPTTQQAWISIHNLKTTALPAPIKKLLSSLPENPSCNRCR